MIRAARWFLFLLMVGGLCLGAAQTRTALAQAAQPEAAQPAPTVPPAEYVPKLGEFAPAGVGQYLVGELVAVDHVNRRGALRLAGDGVDDRYHWAPSHRFAMLPYGAIRYHGAPAELRDIPLGTVLHGYFVLPPEGDKTIPPPDKNAERYVPKYTHALSLEDDFSFYQRQGLAWKIVAIDAMKKTLKVALQGTPAKDGLQNEQTFEFDGATRVWKGRQLAELTDLAPEQVVQVNLAWAPEWRNGQFHLADVWIDQEARDAATTRQRETHLRYERIRGLPAWIDAVEHQADGKGIITMTLFAGRDASLSSEFKVGRPLRVAAAEPTLRTWWGDHDYKGCNIVEVKTIDNPPPGSSGLQIRLQCHEMLEGFRPGRIVRLCDHTWPRIKLPPEERVKSMEDR